MGRRKKDRNGALGTDGNAFRNFTSAVSAIEAHYREASQGVEDSALPPELKKSLHAALTDLLNKQVEALCAGRPVALEEETPEFAREPGESE